VVGGVVVVGVVVGHPIATRLMANSSANGIKRNLFTITFLLSLRFRAVYLLSNLLSLHNNNLLK
jgi:hypothetical protein